MPAILHILTEPEDSLAQEIISRQRDQTDTLVEVVDLTQGHPDYALLLEKIFAADSVQVW